MRGIPVERVAEFKDEFIRFLDIERPDVVKTLADGGEVTMDMGIRIEEAVEEFSLFFLKKGGNE